MSATSTFRFFLTIAATLAIVSFLVQPSALADVSDDSAKLPNCPSGWFYSDRCKTCARKCQTGKSWNCSTSTCEKSASLNLNDDELYLEAVALVRSGQYVSALEALWSIEKRDNPDILTYIGFATRKLGNVERGIGFYHQALALNPDHVRAREYLGEGYLQIGKVEEAKEQLFQIAERCGTDCRQYKMLEAEIIAHVTGEPANRATW